MTPTVSPMSNPSNPPVEPPTSSPTSNLAVEGIADSFGYKLVYSLDIPSHPIYSDGRPAYSEDNQVSVGEFSRIAYKLKLDDTYVWVSMDAFTSDAQKIGVPCLSLACGDGGW